MASTAGTGTMEICVNGRFLSQRITGAQRYAHEVLLAIDEQLSKSPSSAPIEMLVPSSVTEIPKYQFFTVRKVGKWSGQVWEQLELPFYTRGRLLFTPV